MGQGRKYKGNRNVLCAVKTKTEHTQKLQDEAKAVLKGKFIAVNSYI